MICLSLKTKVNMFSLEVVFSVGGHPTKPTSAKVVNHWGTVMDCNGLNVCMSPLDVPQTCNNHLLSRLEFDFHSHGILGTPRSGPVHCLREGVRGDVVEVHGEFGLERYRSPRLSRQPWPLKKQAKIPMIPSKCP